MVESFLIEVLIEPGAARNHDFYLKFEILILVRRYIGIVRYRTYGILLSSR